MNDFDKENLMWLLSASTDELEEFYDEAGMTDLLYMLRLVRIEMTRLQMQELELTDEVESTTDASTLLKQFTLGK